MSALSIILIVVLGVSALLLLVPKFKLNAYLGMNGRQTLRSWTVMETIIAITGLLFTLLVSVFV